LRYSKSKHFVKSKLTEKSSLKVILGDFERDAETHSIASLSTTFFGIIIASLTILLPSISVFIGRPLSPTSEIIFNHTTEKDGY